MKKKLMTMLFAICFMVWLSPVDVFAMNTTVSWKNDVKKLFDCNGGAVSGKCNLNMENKTLTINNGYHMEIEDAETFDKEGIAVYGNVVNRGTIFGGQFDESKAVTNYGTINDGTFKGTVTNEFGCNINGGTFTNEVTNNGRINGGTFTNEVTNDSYIHNGIFEGTVTNNNFIQGGTFNGAVTSENASHITDGIFSDTVTNEGIISGGTFSDTVTNEGIISKGTFNIIVNKTGGIVGQEPDVTYNKLINEGDTPAPNPGENDGNTPPQNPGNDENNTSNSKDNADDDNEYVFVEPVVIVVPEGQKYVENVLEQLSAIPTDGKVIIDTKDWHCFNKTLAEKIADRKDVSVTINYKYQGKKYEVTIPAGSDIVSLLDENGFVGFRYLDAVFGGKEITE